MSVASLPEAAFARRSLYGSHILTPGSLKTRVWPCAGGRGARRNVVTHYSFLRRRRSALLPETRPLTRVRVVRPPPGVRVPTILALAGGLWGAREGAFM